MLVTAIEEYTKGKFKIYIDEQFAFVLYKGELRRYELKIDSEISDLVYEEIVNEIILKRVKRRTLYLLKDMDRTEQQVRNKLKEGYYPEEIIDQAIEYAKGYNYINDVNYAIRYIEYKSNSKSKLEIFSELKQKGISTDIIKSLYEEMNIDDNEVILKLIKKKVNNMNELDEKQSKKLYMYLIRKGFKYEDIEKAVAEIKRNY
jgi:regulatory protein